VVSKYSTRSLEGAATLSTKRSVSFFLGTAVAPGGLLRGNVTPGYLPLSSVSNAA
jgi:hypothetical protein